LTQEDYEQLLSKTSVAEIAAYLKHSTAYDRVLSDISENTVHRGQLEKLLTHASEWGFIRLTHFLDARDKRFIRIYVLENEIELLKQMIRVVLVNDLVFTDLSVNPYFLKYYTFDPYKLAEAQNLTEFLEMLKNTAYHALLAQFFEDSGDLDMFKVEMVLDTYFYRMYWKAVKKRLDGQDRKAVMRAVGGDVDMLNILWILRCKKFFNIPKELIYSFILPVNYRVPKERLVAMVESAALGDAREIVAGTAYSALLEGDYAYLEQMYQTLSAAIMGKIARYNSFSIVRVLHYIKRKDAEISNLIRIIEGVRYNIDKNELRKYLIRGEIHAG
jgi:V/A-type H+-transporting ATPase subunit C